MISICVATTKKPNTVDKFIVVNTEIEYKKVDRLVYAMGATIQNAIIQAIKCDYSYSQDRRSIYSQYIEIKRFSDDSSFHKYVLENYPEEIL